MALPNEVNVGTAPNNGTGDPLRTGGQKINANFVYLEENKIGLVEKGANNGVATLDSTGKLTSSQLPQIAITDVIVANENTISGFAANSGNYTFQQGDVIIIDDGSGNLTHYIYIGGVKTDVNEYSEISASEIDISQVNGLQDALDAKLDRGGNTTDTAQSLRDDIDLAMVIIGRISPNEFHYETTWTDSQKIQAALDKSILEDKNLVIDFNIEHADGIWLLDEAILIPSNAKIFIDTKIKLSNQCRDNFFRTENAGFGITDTLSNPVENFSIKALGRQATLEGADIPRATGDALKTLVVEPTEGRYSYGSDALNPEEKQTGDWRNNAIILVNAHNFEVSGLKFKDVHSRCLQPEICSNYRIYDIETDSHTERIIDGELQLVKNTGGIIVEGPSDTFTIDNVRGYNGDDVVALLSINERTSGIGTYDYSRITGYETLGDIKNFDISNMISMSDHNVIRLLCNSGYKIHNGNIEGINDTRGTGENNGVMVIGDTNPTYPSSDLGSIHSITVNNIKGSGSNKVIEINSLADSTLSNIVQSKIGGDAIVVGGYGTRNVVTSNIIEAQ